MATPDDQATLPPVRTARAERMRRQRRRSRFVRAITGTTAVAVALLLVGMTSTQTAPLIGKSSVGREVVDAFTGTARASAATTPFIAGQNAKSAGTSSTLKLTTSTIEAQKQASTYGRFGFSQGFSPLNMTGTNLTGVLNGIHATGVGVVRLDLPWQQIQAGGPKSYDWTNVLRVYTAAQKAGLKVLPVTSGAPAWATKSPSTTSYYNFLLAAGRVLIPRGITTIEVWNEANLTGLSPAQYTKYALIPGAKGFRQAGIEKKTTVTIVSSGLAPAATKNGDYSQLDFLKGIYAAGGKGYFDVAGDHPYTWPADPTQYTSWNWLQQAQQLRALMVAQGDSGKQIWATEFGFPTNTGDRGISETTQAKYLVEGARVWKSYSWAGTLVFYSYRDLSNRDSDPEHNFGVLHLNGTAKPGLAKITAYIKSK